MTRWRWRGNVALLGVALAFFIYPLLPNEDVINSDWPAFATGARLIVSDPGHLYDLDVQQRVEKDVTGGRVLVTLGIRGILPYLAPAWVALLAVPFEAIGTDLGGRLWILFGLVCLLGGLYLGLRPPHSWGGVGRTPTVGLLPAFASVPTALVLVNAQIDGIVALGLGAAIALWSRPYLAGLALTLTLMKPQLVLPLGVAILLGRRWKVVAGWAAGGVILLAPTLVLNPRWVIDWLGQTRSTVQTGAREVDLPHLTVLLPASLQTAGLALLTVVAIAGVLWLAWRRRTEPTAAAALLIAGGVLAAPHALPADLVLVAMAMAVWGRARWFEWLALSAAALVCALAPVPVPLIVGALVIGWVCLRAGGLLTSSPPAQEPASAR
ncbi:MAG TPA: glycosyltransferase family 87 protein [Candidatus Limnocylindrales bacterium]|nr:glycosyltransferase family 87 protein [Candidatus Limnocylindrales bacterium]